MEAGQRSCKVDFIGLSFFFSPSGCLTCAMGYFCFNKTESTPSPPSNLPEVEENIEKGITLPTMKIQPSVRGNLDINTNMASTPGPSTIQVV